MLYNYEQWRVSWKLPFVRSPSISGSTTSTHNHHRCSNPTPRSPPEGEQIRRLQARDCSTRELIRAADTRAAAKIFAFAL
jgi:hypothetical protein